MKKSNRTVAISLASLITFCFSGAFLIFSLVYNKGILELANLHAKILLDLVPVVMIAACIAFAAQYTYKHIRHSNKQYFNLFESNPTPMGIVDKRTSRFVAVNKASISFYGYSASEFLLLTTFDIWADETKEFDKTQSPSADDTLNKNGVRKHRKKNGEVIIAEVSSTDVMFKHRKCRLLLARDITDIVTAKEDKRIAEKESQRQKMFTSYILENFPVDVAIFDTSHKYIMLNRVAVKNDEMRRWMIGKDEFEYCKRKGMDTKLAVERRARFNDALKGKSVEWIDEHQTDDGVKYVLRKFYPYREDGELKYVYGYGMDITAVKKTQLQRDEYLGQLEKIAFATSHEIRQPICNIQGLIFLLECNNLEESDTKIAIQCLKRSSQVLDDFTRDLTIKLENFKKLLSPKHDI